MTITAGSQIRPKIGEMFRWAKQAFSRCFSWMRWKSCERPATRKKRLALGLRNEVPESCGILPKFVLYWTSLAVASWVWSIILEDNRFKPYSTGFRKLFCLFIYYF